MSIHVPSDEMDASEYVLKATPPRMPRGALARERLQVAWRKHRDRALALTAPAGFGKTTLLLQWRRWWVDAGTPVAWMSAGEGDHPARFALALAHALRMGGVLDSVPEEERIWGRDDAWPEGLTQMLAAIAARRTPVGLVIDDAERLPEHSVRGALQYLLLNAPANLHIAIGSRVALPLPLSELVAKDQIAKLGTEDLRLRFEESNAIVLSRLGERLTLDQRAQLHEATEGWPIGLQLAIGEIERAEDPGLAVRNLSARHGPLQEYFVTSLLAGLAPDTTDALVRASILEHFDADLFHAVTGCTEPQAMLARLVRDTPLMIAGERTEWLRLHPLARDFLLSLFEALPLRERKVLHARASRWFAARERFHEAATHALAAGDDALAQQYAARSLWALSTAGKLAEAREWLDRLPPEMIAGNLELRLVGASVLAFGDRNVDALAMAREVLDAPDTTPQARAIALRIGAGSAVFADRLGLLPGFLARWPGDADEGGGPLYSMAALNTRAMLALHQGETTRVRECIAQQTPYGNAGTLRMAAALGGMLGAMSQLWDGHPVRAEAELHPALLQAEREGRRSVIACLLASVVATAAYQRGDAAHAQALLANRLDVIERSGFPDNVLFAYRTLAFAALEQGDERGAMAALQQLEALAVRRALPRVRAVALSEQIRLHAAHARRETVARLLHALEGLAPNFDTEDMRPLRGEYRLATAIARAHAAIGEDNLGAAERHLAEADALAENIHRGYDVLRIKMLRGVVGTQRGDPGADALLREARELASLTGHARLYADSHPHAEKLIAKARAPARRPLVPGQGSPILTPKESEVLNLLGRGLPNKAIARVLDVSSETVKFHLKNVFVKLSASSRSHALDRARMLGLVP
jgi:LuxR family maltose regulon positive regulatory protein